MESFEEGREKKKRKRRREFLDLEELEEQMRFRFGYLLIQEAEHEGKMRRKALRLARKRRKQADSWVI